MFFLAISLYYTRGDNVKRRVLILLIIVIVSLLTGCGNSSSTTLKKDTVSIALSADVSTLDMHKALGTQTATVCFNIFDSLTRSDADGKVYGLLAESYKPIDDYTWEFKLHKNVTFTNGEPFNAKVVKYNIERMLDKNYGSMLRGDFSDIVDVVVIDDYTINIKTKTPFPGLPLRLTYLGMVPPEYVQKVGDKEFAEKPVGTGPYKLQSRDGTKIVLVANEHYFKGIPEIKTVVFKIIPEESTRVMALQSGEIDIAMAIPSSQTDILNKSQNTAVVSGPANRTMYLGMNTINNEALKNIKVRQAINYAIDKDLIIQTVLGGFGGKVNALSLPQWDGFDASIQGYGYNKEKAKQLLAEAGYGNGLSLEIGVTPGEYPSFKEVADAIASMLSDVGINATVKTYEKGILRNELKNHTLQGLYLMGFGGPYGENNQTLRIICGSNERYSSYNNPEFDKLRMAAGSAMEKAASDKLWSQVQQLIVDDAPVVSLYQLYGIYGMNKQLKWRPRLDEVILASELSYK